MSQTKRPNILWISMEDTSPRFGCYGDSVANTPNIDAFAKEGTLYPNAFCTAGVCAPSRCSIITGMYATSIGAHHMRTQHANRHTPDMPTPYETVPPHYMKLIPEYLRAEGYYCTNNDKTDYQFASPFTAWHDCSKEGHWRNRADKDQPFFAVFNNIITHESGMWEPDSDGKTKTNPDDVTLPPYLPDTPKARAALARQYDNIEKSDQWVGQLLKELKEDGLDDNTLVILWSDHGEGLPRRKRWVYDGGLHIPFIVRWPGKVDAGKTSQQLISLIDLGPTVLDVAGVDAPLHLQGQPFLGKRAGERAYIFASRDRFDESYDMVRAARDDRYKYIRNFVPDNARLQWLPYRNRHPITEEIWRLNAEDGLDEHQKLMTETSRPVEELYDSQADPHELNNLAKDPAHTETLLRMRQAVDSWRSACGDMGEMNELDMKRQWWGGDTKPVTSAPVAFLLGDGQYGQDPIEEGAEIEGPMVLQLHSSTQGASIGYSLDGSENWQLYQGPIKLGPGDYQLRCKAIRIGYVESSENSTKFGIK